MVLKWYCHYCDDTVPWDERCPACRRTRHTGLMSDKEKPSDAPQDTQSEREVTNGPAES
jgi:hypothetical protein